MDFDAVDDLETPFAELVTQARDEVLNGVPVTQQWTTLVEKHDFFKDMVKEAKTRGHLMGSLLVAADGVTHFVQSHAATSEALTHTTAVCDPQEARVLVALSHMYDELFTVSPVPSKDAWREAVESTFPVSSAHTMSSDASVDLRTALEQCTSQPSGSHLHALSSALHEEANVSTEDVDDDGSFVENEFKAFLKRCLQLGRKCARCDSDVAVLKRMLSTISDFLSHSTLEW